MKYIAILSILVSNTYSDKNREARYFKKYNVTYYSNWIFNYGVGAGMVTKHNIEIEIFYKKYKEQFGRKFPLLNFKNAGFLIGYNVPLDFIQLSASTGFGYIDGILRGDYKRKIDIIFLPYFLNSTYHYEKLIVKDSYIPLKFGIGIFFKHFGISLHQEIGFLKDSQFLNIFLGIEVGRFK